MTYAPILWLVFSIATVLRRPGFLLGCVFCALQFEASYDAPILGAVFLLGFLGFTFVNVLLSRDRFRFCTVDALLGLFGLLYLTSALYSPDIATGLTVCGRFLSVCIGYYAIGRFFSWHYRYREHFIFDYGSSLVVLSLIFGALAQSQQLEPGRLHIEGDSAVGFGMILGGALAFCLFYFLSIPRRHRIRKGSLLLAAFGAVLFIVILNGTRGVLVSTGLAFTTFIAIRIFSTETSTRRLRAVLSGGLLGLTAVILVSQVFVGTQNELFAAPLERLVGTATSNFGMDESVSVRFLFLDNAWEMFVESPVFGHGPASYDLLTGYGYPHNLFAELLAENGLLMTVLFSVILWKVGLSGVRLLRTTRFSPAAVIAVGLFLTAFVHQQISGAFWMAKSMFLFMGIIVTLYDREAGDLEPAFAPRTRAGWSHGRG